MTVHCSTGWETCLSVPKPIPSFGCFCGNHWDCNRMEQKPVTGIAVKEATRNTRTAVLSFWDRQASDMFWRASGGGVFLITII